MKELSRLSGTELQVMQCIWAFGEKVTVAQILDVFKDSKGWKTSTVSTILARLIEKGFLVKLMQGKSNIYTATFTQEQYIQNETKSFFKQVHNGSMKSFMTALVEDSDITKSDIEQLREWLNQELK